ncbi:MAG: tetratricopeptide repeat protein [Acidobacteriia bacterium]|nr:tetratricopeptide repeat protein [Terriglobia bacterium]
MLRRLCVWMLLASPLAFAASKEILELQRDVAALQEQLRQFKESQDRQLTALTTLMQTTLDTAGKSNTTAAVIQDGLQRSLRDMEAKVVAPVAGLSTRMDSMSQDMRALATAVADLTNLLTKLQGQITDLSNAVKVMGTPTPPPPPGTSGGTTAPGATGTAETPTISSTDLYANAQRDRGSGKLELALQEYADYLKWYGNTELAPNAQFYIASIHYSQGDYETAVKEFDLVLERYPENNKTPDALFSKGLALQKLNRRTDGAKEFRELIRRFPNNDLSKRACDQLKSMGLSCGPPRAAAPKGSTKRKK